MRVTGSGASERQLTDSQRGGIGEFGGVDPIGGGVEPRGLASARSGLGVNIGGDRGHEIERKGRLAIG